MLEKIDLSLILACYKDASYLEQSVDEIFKVLDMTKLCYEIIFVYDCGTDGTLEVIEKLIRKFGNTKKIVKIIHQRNRGRGKSVRDGIIAAKGDIAGYIDVDLDIPPRYIPSMVRAIVNDGYDVATAFRYYKISLNPLFIIRHILSHGYRFISRFLLSEHLKDTESGYKFFKRDKIIPLLALSHYDGWFWDTEIMTCCIYNGLKIKEIPCVFDRRIDKKSAVNIFRTVMSYFFCLIQFKLYLLKHKEELVGK